jgi:hypothetical protein
MRRFFLLGIVVLAGCDSDLESNRVGASQLNYNDFELRFSEGIIYDSHYVANKTPYDLKNVYVSFTATGVDRSEKTIKQYWAVWSKGETKQVDATGDAMVPTIQKLQVHGYCDGYTFGFLIYRQ